uniref:Uncharacterized protein n=1 Tax=Neolamprologus brichardi TaxID=32507 RepID=A0A3Q4HP29_NEOBR
ISGWSVFQCENSRSMVGQALEELLVEAYHQNCLRIGVIESYKYMKANPHRVVLCVLASEKETEGDIMLQMNLIQLKDMCYKKNVRIMCSTDMRRLAELVTMDDISGNEASRDLHCILVTLQREKKWGKGEILSFRLSIYYFEKERFTAS